MASREEINRDVEAVGRISAVPTILEVVARTTGMRFTAVARVTETSWTACAVHDEIAFGLQPGSDLVVETTICNEIRQHGQPVIFGEASKDPAFCNHPTPKMYGFESYVSIPIFRADGSFFGTLCAIDPRPARLDDPNLRKSLQLFAQLIAAQLDLEDKLGDARETAKLREQFIAVLGHDLRQPLQAIEMSAAVLDKASLEGSAQRMVRNIRRSTARMSEMIRNVLDFARGRLGGGIPVALRADDSLGDGLRHVIDEVKASYPERAIDANVVIEAAVVCDRGRIEQLLANLLINAVTHGSNREPVRVSARSNGQSFELSVANAGEPIAAGDLDRLFRPFSRSASSEPGPGLGLGLYIAAEIAKAHAGKLDVYSSADGTRFVFTMPLRNA